MTEPQTFACPPWCTAHPGRHGTFTHQMFGQARHEPDEAVIVLDAAPPLGIREVASVSACRIDSEDGSASFSRVELNLDAAMTAGDARKIADTLLWAADLIDPADPTSAGVPLGTRGASVASLRAFPVGQRRHSDERFGSALAYDVARVLADHGYPMPAAGADLAALQRLLGGFLYGGGAQ